MNFFGHAALAASHFASGVGGAVAPSPRELSTLCLGSMLPDFIGMLRLTRPSVDDAALARGVAFHHRTDEVFHDLPSFHRLSRQAFAWLSERQLPRGPARAVAHMGIEMLLDEVLAREQQARDAYQAALEIPLGPLLTFPEAGDAERLRTLQRALLGRSATERAPAAELVAERIVRSLSGRPRLATDQAGQQLLGGWVEVTRPLVAAEAPEVLAALREQLANFSRGE